MAAADQSTVQPTLQEAVAGWVQSYTLTDITLILDLLDIISFDDSPSALPHVVPQNAAAGPVGAQLPADVPHAVQAHPQNVVPPNPPGAQVVAGPIGAIIPAAGLVGPGASPLLRSLYGRLGN
ncbi:hypothetical protein FRC11_010451 [Ceratobasidium sp. 423]|nr:hypothetical protein FRC11_010451 [Ceratobasidium sp. 423]